MVFKVHVTKLKKSSADQTDRHDQTSSEVRGQTAAQFHINVSGSRASCPRRLSLTSTTNDQSIDWLELIRPGCFRSERSLLGALSRETKSTVAGDRKHKATERLCCVHGSTQSSGIIYTLQINSVIHLLCIFSVCQLPLLKSFLFE